MDPCPTQPHCRCDGGLDHVDGFPVDRHEDVDVDRVGRTDGAAPGSLVGTGPPEARCLDQVEQLGNDQDAVERTVADTLRRQEPAEVPEGQRHIDGQKQPHAMTGRASKPCRLAPDIQQPRISRRVHWNTHTCTLGRWNAPASRRRADS
jgi:hypothetical protein